jgi:hypothetical protein
MFHLRRGKGFGESVGNHVIGRAVNEVQRAIFNDPSDEMETNIDVFGPGVVLVVFRKGDG